MAKPISLIKTFILVALVVNSVGMFLPSLSSTFTPYYGSIAKHIIQTNNWNDLIFSGHDWLDKPHLPFWLTALSFKVFGVSTFSYVLPGFIFYIIGLFFTYKLGTYWFNSETGIIAALLYSTSLHLLLSSIDVRAEAYLLGEIMPASYFWLKYNDNFNFKHLVTAAIFTALAIMTKGIFVLITIISGLATLWIYNKNWGNFISLKWLLGLALSITLIGPELIALYQQFDLHPEKIVFDHTHVSGLKWFFWDSQFGRFFNTGPIMSTNPPPFHYLFFVHTFMWSFLPWSPIFLIALYQIIRNYKLLVPKDPYIYLLGSFFITFILFSVTTFQVDHYINILLPFACILSAQLLVRNLPYVKLYITYTEITISVILMLATILISPILFNGFILIIIEILAILTLILSYTLKSLDRALYTLIIPSMTILVIFILVSFTNGIEYAKYDAGYQIAKILDQEKPNPIKGYQVDLLSLDFNANSSYQNIESLGTMDDKTYYLVTTKENFLKLKPSLDNFKVVKSDVKGSDISTFISGKFNTETFNKNLKHYIVLEINPI